MGLLLAFMAVAGDDAQELERRIAVAKARRERWERVIDTHARLKADPSQASRAAADAARDLKASGRELVVEGATRGLSGFFLLHAEYASNEEVWRAGFATAASTLEAFWRVYAADRVRSPDKPEPPPKDVILKVNALLNIPIGAVRDPKLRAILQAVTSLGKAGVDWLDAYVRGDEPNTADLLSSFQAALEGTRGVMLAFSANATPEQLKGIIQALAGRYPKFAPLAGFMASTALADIMIAIQLANLSWGSYAWFAGRRLENTAREIERDQQRALRTIEGLLPRARQEIESAWREETAAKQELELLRSGNRPALRVVPSRRLFDDGVGIPPKHRDLPQTSQVVGQGPKLQYGITQAELERRAEARRKAEEEARRQRRAAEQAHRDRVRAEREWSHPRDRDSSPSYRSGSGIDASRVERTWNRIADGLNRDAGQNWVRGW